jgi:hypothetical protein
MPRYIVTSEPRHPQHEKFVKKLARELTSTGTNLQPLILEEQLPVTKSTRVHVIWNDWKPLSFEQRSEVIRDAYKRAEGERVASRIEVAAGLTAEEALVHGLLPYKVELASPKGGKVASSEYRRAISTEAPHTLLGPGAPELRYARLEDAEESRKRLQEAFPDSSWTVVQEQPTES